MACYNPSACYVFYDKNTGENGHSLVIKDYDFNKLSQLKAAIGTERSFYNKTLKVMEDCICTDAVLVPCNHCVGCCSDISRSWMHRMVLENETSKCSYFLTLTYDDKHIPKNHQLKKEHLQKFIKDLRNYFKNNYDYDHIRYYAVGEYGSKSARCHYHILVYNLPLTPLEFEVCGLNYDVRFRFKGIGCNEFGDALYQFDLLDFLWKKGFVTVGSVTPRSCAYVSRYVDKKRMTGEKNKELKRQGIEPEFSLCSKRPGIGFYYYEKYWKDILKNNLEIVITGGQRISVGRYFEKFMEEEHPEYLEEYKRLKESKALYGKTFITKLDHNFDTINQGLKAAEKIKFESYKTLKRNL